MNFSQLNIGNGLLHHNGARPYDKNMTAAESKLWIICTLGEGYHNYHHVFPYDYRAAEFGGFFDWNIGAWFIDICAYFGWAYDLKKASQSMIERRMRRTGDGSHWLMKNKAFKEKIWGYGDENIESDDKIDLEEVDF